MKNTVFFIAFLVFGFVNHLNSQNDTPKELMKNAYSTMADGNIDALADLIITDKVRSLEDAKGMAELIIHFENNDYGDFYKKNKTVIDQLKVGSLNKYLFSAFMFERIPPFYNCFRNGEHIKEKGLFGIKEVNPNGKTIGKFYEVKKIDGAWKFWPEKLAKEAPIEDVNAVFKMYTSIVENNESIENKQKALDKLIATYKYTEGAE